MSQYEMMFRRRSIRKYDAGPMTQEDLKRVEGLFSALKPLLPDIRTELILADRKETGGRFDENYVLFYSEKKEHYEANAGFMLEQLDLMLEESGVGVCWYGMAKPETKTLHGLDFVIMLAIGKLDETLLRTSDGEYSRKELSDIWTGKAMPEVARAVRLAPSACNSQPWRFLAAEDKLEIWQETKYMTIMPPQKKAYFNAIDMGILLCFLELSLAHEGISFERKLCKPNDKQGTRLFVAEYALKSHT